MCGKNLGDIKNKYYPGKILTDPLAHSMYLVLAHFLQMKYVLYILDKEKKQWRFIVVIHSC